MSRLIDVLSEYACYHRDPRNLATHMFGVPMIMLGTAALLSRPGLPMEPRLLSPALIVAVLAAGYYLRIDRRLGIVMSLVLTALVALAHQIASQPTALWLGLGLGLLLGGWMVQFVGHYFEGRKPAFVDDLSQLLIGPLFITVEVGFMLGLGHRLRLAVEHRAGRVQRHRSHAGTPRMGL
ncbi:Mpo1 family 2-hydroxy fatty acid dioxygenase [Frateuria aurantia]